MNKNPWGWVFLGLAVVTVSLLLADDWSPGSGFFYNIQEGTIGQDIPLNAPVIVGFLLMFWGAYLKARNSN